MYELKITATSIEDLAQQVLGLAVALGSEPVVIEATPSLEEKAKAVAAKPAKAVAAKKAEPKPEPEPDATVAVKLLDFNTEVAPFVVAAVDSHGKELVASVLTEFGKARASEIDPSLWPEFLKSLADAVEAVS
jgi:hypothetical protein